MNWQVIRTLFIHEMKLLVRARRTIVMAVVIPVVIMPIMLFATKFTEDQRQRTISETTYKYAIAGPLSDRVRELLSNTRKEIDGNPDKGLDTLRGFKLEETSVANPRESLDRNDIHFYIETISGEEADKLPIEDEPAAGAARPSGPPAPRRLKGVPIVKVVYLGNRDSSENGRNRITALLQRARRADTQDLLSERGFRGSARDLFTVGTDNVATPGQVTGSTVGRFITLFLVMLMFTGGGVAAVDIISGEKERGTLETLLTTAVGRAEIVAAKQLAITSVALVITLIQGLNFFIYIKLQVIELPASFHLELPTSMALTLLALFLPLAAVVGSLLLMMSAYAKSYKEAQMYFLPVYLVSLVPALASLLPGISLRSAIAVVPLANVSVAAREIMMGRPDFPMILVTFGVMVFASAYLMRASARLLAREDIVLPAQSTAAEFLGGPALFEKRVLRWFALMWVIQFAVAADIPQLATIRRQIVFNLLVLMLGATVLMIRTYRLNVKQVLNLRPVKPVVWLAILFAIPTGQVAALAVFQVMNVFIPAPESVLRAFSETLLPDDIPKWQLFFFLAVLPGICEELTFRGMLLSGLRRKLRPVALAIAVGLIFGVFHVMLFRIAPTAVLGMILASITIMTGSVFPGILLHMGNNALGIGLALNGFSLDKLTLPQYAAALAIFALSMWIIYRNRTPLPARAL